MHLKSWCFLVPAFAVAACGQPLASPGVEVHAGGGHYTLMAVSHLPVAMASADSQGLPAANAIDGDLTSAWTNGGFKNATASWTAQLAASVALGGVEVKTGPMAAGTSYDVQVSTTGTTWTTVLAKQANTTWLEERKAFPAGIMGKYVRLMWHNSATNPVSHFALYELEVEPPGAGLPSALPSPVDTPEPEFSPPTLPSPVTSPTTAPSPITSPATMPSPVTSPSASPSGLEVKPLSVSASSSGLGTPPEQAIDANAANAWSNAAGGEKDAWLALKFAAATTFTGLQVKTGPMAAGASYTVEVSANGTTWTPVSGSLTNSSWLAEAKPVAGSGMFIRLHFANPNPAATSHFAVYDVHVLK